MVVMMVLVGPLWCIGIIPPPLSVLSVLSFMNILTTFRTFVGIIIPSLRWDIINILRRRRQELQKSYTLSVGGRLK
jgi:hypothetical protein